MTPPIVKRFLISLNKNKFIGLFAFLASVGASGFVAMQPPPPKSYFTGGSLAFEAPPPIFTKTGEQIQESGRNVTKDMLLAPPVLEAVTEKVDIEPKKIVENIKMALPEEGQPLIVLGYPNQNPEEATKMMELLMEEMVKYSEEQNKAQLKAKIEAIQKRLPEAERELKQAERNLDQYIRKEGSAILAAQDGSLVGRITSSQQQQEQTELALEEIDAQIKSIGSRLGLNPDQAYANSALSADPIIANIRGQLYQLETQIGNLERDLRPEHPTMIELYDQLEVNERLLAQRVEEVLGGEELPAIAADRSGIRTRSSLDPVRRELANQLVGLDTQRDTLLRQLETLRETEQELRQEYEQFPNKQMEQQRLQQEVALQQNYYNQIKTALVDAQAAEVETTGSLRIAEPASTGVDDSNKPTSPLIIIAAGGFVGILLAGGVIFLLSALDSRLHTPEEIKGKLQEQDIPLLGEIPYISSLAPHQEETPILLDPDSPYLPYYERLRSNLSRMEPPTPKVILVTSATKEEGKTITAYNLAITSASAGKRTLLIEADLRKESEAKTIKVAPDPEANSEPLLYYGSQSNCVRLVPDIENLYLIPSPGEQKRPAAVLESSEFKKLFEEVKRRFDMVIVDAPSLSACNDALLIQPLTDGMVMVARPGETKGGMLTEALDHLTEAELPLLGLVVNGMDEEVEFTPPAREIEELDVDFEPNQLGQEQEQEEEEAVYR